VTTQQTAEKPLGFDTAGEHASASVPQAHPDSKIREIRLAIIGKRFDSATNIAICEDGKLTGLLTIESLLAAPEDAVARELMDSDPPIVRSGADQELAAWKAVQHGESSLAVTDELGRFVGLVPPRRLLSVLLEEHHEDMARLAGLLKGALTAKIPLQEPVRRRLGHRVPWLMMGLAGAMLAADIVASFSNQLQANVALAFFLPGLVYLADAVGTQTETLVVRGLSVGIPMGRVIARELATGVLIGTALAIASVPIALWRWTDPRLAGVLAVSLLGACSVATLVAIALPWGLSQLDRDPAFGSGPLATVVQDLLSILIYFLVAGLFFR
jgi:magnesium transporter